MKTKYLFLMLFSAILFIGCSTDNQEAFLNDSSSSILSEDYLRAKIVTRPFKVKGSGTFEIVAPADCGIGLTQALIQGQGNATHLGLFDVTIISCTNFNDIYYLTGVQTAANGDELYFYSVGIGVDEEGQWTDYIIEGGTGRFENAIGELRLYAVNEFTGPTTGVYSNYGSGTLTY